MKGQSKKEVAVRDLWLDLKVTYLCSCVCLCRCVCVSVCYVYAGAQRGQKMTSDPLELELQTVAEIKLKCSRRATNSLSH